MWIFLPGGLLMPARIPNGGSEGTADPKLTNDGEYTLQVRGRVDSHLQNFIRDYMEPLDLPFSDIEYTPQFDYNVRFYTTPAAFATAIAAATLDIDYLKFKPTAEDTGADGKPLYKDGRAYHNVLNSIWGSVCALGRPGGVWGRLSSSNPNGYQRSKDFGNKGYADRAVGASFGSRDPETEPNMDYIPDKDEYISDLLSELSDIPMDQWEDYVTAEDYELLTPFKITDHRNSRQQRKVLKKASKRYRRGASKK